MTGSVATHCCSAAGASHLTAAARPRRKFPPIHGLAPSISSSLASSTPPFRLRYTLRNSILPMAHLNRAPYPPDTRTRALFLCMYFPFLNASRLLAFPFFCYFLKFLLTTIMSTSAFFLSFCHPPYLLSPLNTVATIIIRSVCY